jgi:hypothetical protein
VTAPLEHVADRPAWNCRVCREPWPCTQAKDDLLEEFRDFPSTLIIQLSGQMAEAADDLLAHDASTLNLHDRFVAWARPSRPDEPDI